MWCGGFGGAGLWGLQKHRGGEGVVGGLVETVLGVCLWRGSGREGGGGALNGGG